MKSERLGWIIAAALAGGMVGMGFQDKTEKTGVVDLAKVFNNSDIATKQNEVLHNMGNARVGVLQFLQQNIHMKPEDAKKFRDLQLKETPTATEKADLERVKSDAQANETACNTIMTKPSPSDGEKAQFEDFNKRKDANVQLLDDWNREFSNELGTKKQTLHDDTMSKVKDAVSVVAKKQGYSIVFSMEAVPFGANDLTTDALNQINKK